MVNGVPAQHKGYANVQAVLHWMEAQKFQLDQLALLGYSAGALGLQFHAHNILTRFKPTRAVVVFDSFVGVARRNVDSKIFKQQGVCKTQLLDWNQELKSACKNEKITVPSITNRLIQAFPEVQFVGITSKTGKYYILRTTKCLIFILHRSYPTSVFPSCTHQIYRSKKFLQSRDERICTIFKTR